MKKAKLTTILSRTLAVIISVMMLLPVIPNVFAEEPVYISVGNGTGTRSAVEAAPDLGYRAIVNAPFTSFGFTMPTWNTTDSECDLSLYKWEGTFAATIAKTPIATQHYAPLTDNATNTLSFSEQPAGEYLFYIGNVIGKTGTWTALKPTNPKGFLYTEGDETRGDPELQIGFTSDVDEPFGDCAASVSDKPETVDVPYDNTNTSIGNIEESLAVRFKVKGEVSGVKVKLATYYATDIDMTMSVYEWKGSYDESVKAGALRSKTVRLRDNAMQGFTFDLPIPAGEYIFAFENPTANTAVYNVDNAKDYKGIIYKHGVLVESATSVPMMQIIFAKKADSYFDTPSKDEATVDGKHTAPEEYVIPEDSKIKTHEVMPDTWVFTDALGRTSLTNADVGDPKDDKTVAIFYWTWHTSGSTTAEPFNNQKFMEEHPEAMHDYGNPLWPTNAVHFWNEPIYGYYTTNDEWVLRRQAELLANAGIDTVFTDNTNGTSTWRESYLHLYNAWDKAMTDGVLTPKVSYMLPFWDKGYTNTQVTDIYLDIYRTGKWQNLWFYYDGKPMLMAMPSAFGSSSNSDKEIKTFFTFRQNDPDYMEKDPQLAHWGWLSMYPQTYYYANKEDKANNIVEQITVGTAMNHNYELHMLSAMNGENIAGRSYTSKGYHTEENAKLYGYNLAEQWEYALEINPKVVFVTGWNEWKAGRYEAWPEGSQAEVKNAFPDQCNDEYSRDIEPTKGDLKDNYYYELVNYVRRYKGARAIPLPTAEKTINIANGDDQWEDVGPYFAAYIGNTGDRDTNGYGSTHYTEFSGRNDIIGSKISRDTDNLYFWVECNEDITPYTDPLWMTLYIDCNQDNQGWETFDYVINKTSPTAATATLEKFTGNGYETVKVADVKYTVNGKTMQIEVPKSAIGISGDKYTVNFAWTDNVHDEADAAAAGDTDYKYTSFSGDIMDFYISGDVAPGGRFKFSYIVGEEQQAEETTAQTDETAGPDLPDSTTVATDETTVPDSTSGVTEGKGGCGSAIGYASAAVATAVAGVVLTKNKKRKRK